MFYKFKFDRFEELLSQGKEIDVFGKGKTAYNYHFFRVENYKAALWRLRVRPFSSSVIFE